MVAYVVRSGARVLPNIDELEHFTLSEGLLSVSFVYDDAETDSVGFRQSALDFDTRADIRVAMHDVMSEGSAQSAAAQLWRFAHEMLVDDMVILPRHAASSSVVAVGRVVGPYFFEDDHHPNAVGPHLRRVFWYTCGQRQLFWPLCANYFGRSGSGVIVVCNCRSCACRPCASLVR